MTLDLTDYQNRKIDLLALQGGIVSTSPVLLTQQLAGPLDAGEICVGIQKLAQRWVLAFFTEAGSVPYNPGIGTTFMTALRTGQIQTESALLSYFTLANQTAAAQMLAQDSSTDPQDECYGSVTLISSNVVPGSVELHIQIVSAAGSAATFILPIPIVAT